MLCIFAVGLSQTTIECADVCVCVCACKCTCACVYVCAWYRDPGSTQNVHVREMYMLLWH